MQDPPEGVARTGFRMKRRITQERVKDTSRMENESRS
jgi:hypothetical protein